MIEKHDEMQEEDYLNEKRWLFWSEGSLDVGQSVTHSLSQSHSTQSKQSKSNSTKHGEIKIMTLYSYQSVI